MPTIFKDKVQTYHLITAILVITCLIFLIILMSQYTDKPIALDNASKTVLAIILLLNVFILASFRELNIKVSDTHLIFGFMKFRKRILISKIKKIEFSEYKFQNYLGYGIRFGRDKTVGYVPRGGKGLVITVAGQRRPYFFVTNRPEELKAILEQRKK
ncbi:hypothetical protein HN858_01105 [Candidatus Falkowbacteria bacterium]|jgi:hypothetical protein|nr:hypothetical protein [Candidatus Falkowbacteria bacterium]MBT6574308.1 hypothetical protein [Candidatus Falkowbacteria bacterium]MBT7348253.1 hypothetical protein [Candidatus Falkowbacteria bacterium]MBT7500232.1 hypothetical protein [Candidatus Falkowbacteria bacterium]